MHNSVPLTKKPRGALFALRRRITSADKKGDNSCRKRKYEAPMTRPPPKHGGPSTRESAVAESNLLRLVRSLRFAPPGFRSSDCRPGLSL